MANEQNLKPQAHKLTVEEQSRGGIASGKARREKKQLRELLEMYLSEPATINGEVRSRKDLMAIRAVQIVTEKEIGRDVTPGEFARAFELVRDTIGEKPVERVESVEIAPEVYERVERALRGD